jgi:hypothetical protein
MDTRISAFLAELVHKNPARKHQNHYSHGKGYIGIGRNDPPMEPTKHCNHGVSPSEPKPKRRRSGSIDDQKTKTKPTVYFSA